MRTLEKEYKLKTFESYTVNNNSYHIFRVERQDMRVIMSIIWGKTDFRVELEKIKNRWTKKNLQIFKNHKHYSFVKTSEHGIVNDEFLWVAEESEKKEELYIELPKDFDKVISEVCRQAIEKRGW